MKFKNLRSALHDLRYLAARYRCTPIGIRARHEFEEGLDPFLGQVADAVEHVLDEHSRLETAIAGTADEKPDGVPRITIRIDCAGDAFSGDRCPQEIERLLRETAEKFADIGMDWLPEDSPCIIRDANGNVCGMTIRSD